VRVGTEGISIPGIYIPNIPVKEPEQPPTDPRSWRVAQNVRRCKLILLCSHPQDMNDTGLRTVLETANLGRSRRAEARPEAFNRGRHHSTGRVEPREPTCREQNEPTQPTRDREVQGGDSFREAHPTRLRSAMGDITQDAITTCVQTELRALESDDRMASCRIQS